ncbi:MAG: hypothetical protein ACO1OY_08705, partial [Ramlibacter sp.]
MKSPDPAVVGDGCFWSILLKNSNLAQAALQAADTCDAGVFSERFEASGRFRPRTSYSYCYFD